MPTSLPLLQMNTINEEVPYQQVAHHVDSFSAAQTPIKPIGSGQNGHTPIEPSSPIYHDVLDAHKHGLPHGPMVGPGQQSVSYLQLPYINLAGADYQAMQAAHASGSGAGAAEEGKGQYAADVEAAATPYTPLGQYDKGTPGGQLDAAGKNMSRSPNKRKGSFAPAARRPQEIKGSLNMDLQIHQRNEKITSNEDIRLGMSLNAAPEKAQAGHARGPKQAIQQILNNKSQ